jgi:radical SAM superfamily enzyme YgiQ (UPF0313 family)
MQRILLVSPLRGSDFAREDIVPSEGEFQFPRALMPPLDLATIKALTPPDFEVDIWDESIRGPIREDTDLGKDYDLLGATAYMTHIPWAQEFAKKARRLGKPVVIGGPGVSGAPERCRNLFDVVFIGEAEFTWRQFLQDWRRGKHRPEYRQVERPDVEDSPAPCWDDFAGMANDYLVGPVQTTRGCPFDCEFCDVIHLFGRQSRHKPVETVLKEVANLKRLGMRRVFFCDDNFIGEPKYAKELLRSLVPLNNSFERPLGYGTQLTLNVAKDDELLELMADCNFGPVLIGVESPRQECLREANKPQNYKTDIIADLKKIQSLGISVRANMIVGFDHDDLAIFDETFEFLQDSGTANPGVSVLKAYPGTPLLARLQREGRVIQVEDDHYHSPALAMTNIVPKQMSRVELMRGAVDLHQRLRDWDNFAARVKKMLAGIKRKPDRGGKSGAPDPKHAGLFLKFIMTLEPKAQKVIFELMGETERRAPWLKETVGALVLHQVGYARNLPTLVRTFQDRIDLESSPGYEPRVIRTLPRIPTNFKNTVHRDAFPRTYRAVVAGLGDTRLVPEALIRVWKDFLIRWGETFTTFEDYHYEHLRELCDRSIEQGNAGQFSDAQVNAAVDGLTDQQLRRLAGEVLVSVEQDLRGVPQEDRVSFAAG